MSLSSYSLQTVDLQQWNNLCQRCLQFNLLQSWEYGEAKKQQGWQPLRFAVYQDDQVIAIVQVLTKAIGPIGFVARINRGPIFLDNKISLESVRGTFECLNKQSFKRRWLYLSISPELPPQAEFADELRKLGYTQRPAAAWGSLILDLQPSQEQLFRNLQNPWPKNLRRTEHAELVLKEETAEQGLETLLERYREMQTQMKFTGIPDVLLRELGKQKSSTWDVRILHAVKNDQVIASLLNIGSQNLCTPLIAWADPGAREFRGNNFVYWHSFLKYKYLGFRWYDMGGLNSETPEGIATFKKGMGGQAYTLIGEWQRPLILPKLTGRLLKGK